MTNLKNRIYWLHFLLLLLLLIWPAAAPAQTRTLTLDQAIEIARERNRDIQKAGEYIARAKGKYVEERAAALPQVTATGLVVRDRDGSQKIYGDAMADPASRQSAQIVLTQPVFTWGQIGSAIRAADRGLKSADEQLRLYRQAVQRDVMAAFYDALLAQKFHELALQDLEQKKRHLTEAQKKYAAGVATDYDVLTAEVSVQNAGPRAIRTENAIRTAHDRLRILLALDDDVISVSGSLEAHVSPVRTYEEAIALARVRRPDLADMKYRIQVSRELVAVYAAQNKPRLDFKGAYGWNRIDQGWDRGDGAVWSAGIYLTYRLFDGLGSRGRVAQAKSDLRRLMLDEAQMLQRAGVEVREAMNAVNEAAAIIQALSGTVGQAQRLLGMAEKGFVLGVKTRLDVEDAELNLQEAQSNLSRACRDYRVARTHLDWVTGILGEESHERQNQ